MGLCWERWPSLGSNPYLKKPQHGAKMGFLQKGWGARDLDCPPRVNQQVLSCFQDTLQGTWEQLSA